MVYIYTLVWCLFNLNKKSTNKGICIVVEACYDLRKDINSIHGEDVSWESKPNYIKKY